MKDGSPFSNGEFVCTIKKFDSSPFIRDGVLQVWLEETGLWTTLHEIVPEEPEPRRAHSTSDPGYYSRFEIQPTEFIIKNKLPFCEGNVVKYVCRHDAKNGADDIKKAIRYLQFILEHTYGIKAAVVYDNNGQ
jgi:hypothetical protein